MIGSLLFGNKPLAILNGHVDLLGKRNSFFKTSKRWLGEFVIPTSQERKTIFVVGLYKCGTSWLLKCFGRHPSVVAVRETDLIRAHFQIQDGNIVHAFAPHERLRNVFCNYGFLPIRGEPARMEAQEILKCGAPAEECVERLLALSGWTNPRRRIERFDVAKVNRPISAFDIPIPSLGKLYEAVRSAVLPIDSMNAFLSTISDAHTGEFVITLKAADQIPLIDEVSKCWPGAKKIVIMRDGRDASVSTVHYEKLAVARKPPLGKFERDYFDVLKAWAKRAQQVSATAHVGQIAVIRYEDLIEDFEQTLGGVFDWVGLTSSHSVLSNIKSSTSFESVTGRARGIGARDVVRKGAVGDWKTALNKTEEEAAWNIAGDMLTEFGYGRDGRVKSGFPGRLD